MWKVFSETTVTAKNGTRKHLNLIRRNLVLCCSEVCCTCRRSYVDIQDFYFIHALFTYSQCQWQSMLISRCFLHMKIWIAWEQVEVCKLIICVQCRLLHATYCANLIVTKWTVTKTVRHFGHAMQKIIIIVHFLGIHCFTVCKHGNISTAWLNCQAGFATECEVFIYRGKYCIYFHFGKVLDVSYYVSETVFMLMYFYYFIWKNLYFSSRFLLPLINKLTQHVTPEIYCNPENSKWRLSPFLIHLQ